MVKYIKTFCLQGTIISLCASMKKQRQMRGKVTHPAVVWVYCSDGAFGSSPQVFLLSAIFFFTMVQVLVFRKDSGQRAIMRLYIS